MIPYKDFKFFALILLFFAFAKTSQAQQNQYNLSGTITAANTGEPISNAEVFCLEIGRKVETDASGNYRFNGLSEGSYTLSVFALAFDLAEKNVSVSADTRLDFELDPLGENLNEVMITARKRKIFALRQLKPVEGTAIYAGKKSEVVQVDNLTANLSSGTARQIYAQVVGLNIYENNDAGLQLNIGGRGLDPNRSANFNTRQNGYDISADVLGYPESYYTPPAEALESIEVVRGAASLQYGTQFGGLINFKLKQPVADKKIEWTSRQSLGSYNLFTSFNSLSGTVDKTGYYAYFNYKKGDGFRPNSQFDSYNAYLHLDQKLSDKTKLIFEGSYLYYLAQQPGGLTDRQFEEDPTFSNRSRNWFAVDWKLFALRLEHSFSEKTDFSLQLFTLAASRKTVGFRVNRVNQPDDFTEPRDLIIGDFQNWGAEARFLTRYNLLDKENTFLIGGKYYQSNNSEQQGPGTTAADADFNFATEDFPTYERQSDYTFPNLNLAAFTETIININNQFSITPGARFEYIKTQAEGFYKNINTDNAGNVILDEDIEEDRNFDRSFVLLGVGMSYKPSREIELYSNISQNYRSVTFNDIRIVNPTFQVDPDIKDENGFTFDLGLRGRIGNALSYDVGAFYLRYRDRLGIILKPISDIQSIQFRGNIGDASIYGIETFADYNIWDSFSSNKNYSLRLFGNLALTQSEYTASQENNVEGNQVEFIPDVNLKTGINFGYKNLLGSLQYTYLSKQFTDATNSERDFTSTSGIIGEIPAYDILDLSLSYTYKKFRLETGINNLLDNSYFVRRATGYPGPGIIPSQPRTWYATLQFKL
ncbi:MULTISPECIES: TonB-dependent receptor [unclassified Leeuwenhoekiella]|uniref:TonB-dependent receptor n=1 Tax=unclassified Leeuwenhoekiella TaxID=2615029 RepID=UPI000C5EFE1F|nr:MULTISPECIES: TonB-dependent receptor [unclassified Leeuwenhoekiella]MAW95124.1 TonB-dependent receptor [Leeuwenhoekiella sp.]MBA79844.1 TonB-dependent receptor [Leeuwenhoekiella sp.]|tara:strand:+ start:534 stop:2993 length:2460 start_codon:yes stop_codon:yes gene_type:complete